MKVIVTISLLLALAGCATRKAAETPYNRGVDAYRAKDYASARIHWAKATEDDDPSALNNLAYLLYSGLGGEPDQARAVTLWRRAALTGHSEAQWHLGRAFEAGTAVSQSLVEAYAWYRCAIVNAESVTGEARDLEEEIAGEARKSLAKIVARLTKEQFESGESLAKQYISRYAKPRM